MVPANLASPEAGVKSRPEHELKSPEMTDARRGVEPGLALPVGSSLADDNAAHVGGDGLPIPEDTTGRNFWVAEEEIDSIQNLLPSCIDILAFAKNPEAGWFERTYDM